MRLLQVLSTLMFAATLTACTNAGEVAHANNLNPQQGALRETQNSDKSAVAWLTETTVSPKRKIEVGDHPGLLLEQYQIGGRGQRVRLLLADDRNIQKYISGSPQDVLFKTDSKVAKSENDKWSPMAMIIEAPANLGLAKFSDDSTFNGLAVSPQLLLCATGALKNLADASTNRNRVYQNWQINEVNVLVKPVQHSAEAESKMAIDSKLHALNFQVSLWTRSGDCFLPSVTEIGTALDIANQRVED